MILSKLVLVENINRDISDNSTGDISPYDIRHNFLDIIDSIHLLTSGENIISRNFSSFAERSTRAGLRTLDKFGLDGYTSVDNSAFGHEALKSNYQGSRNTALGSTAISCNIYGSDNVGVGYSSLGGNTTGFGNVGVGSYSLSNNRLGNWNIAIGHAAGYYSKDLSNKLFIASHPVDSDHICQNPLGSGWTPLVYGDLQQSSLRFGIATRSLHAYGTLQVSGAISPSDDGLYNLGNSNYKFKDIYLASGIRIGNKYLSYGNNQSLYLNTNLIPSDNNFYNLGSSSNRWAKGFFDQIVANSLVATQKAHYLHTTIYLASSGYIDTLDGGGAYSVYDYYPPTQEVNNPSAYLPDSGLLGAGLVLRSNARQFEFLFKPHNNGNFQLNCYEADNVFSRSHWSTNVSLHLNSGCHILTDRVVGYDDTLSLTTNSGCFGLYIDSGRKVLVSNEYWVDNRNNLAGLSDFNIVTSGSSDYHVGILAPESGVSIVQKFLSASRYKSVDSQNSNKDKLEGFCLKYTTGENTPNYLSDRFSISSYNKTSRAINSFVLLKDAGDGGVCGINDLDIDSDLFVPKTTLNVRSKLNGTIRLSSEALGLSQTSLQLVASNNCLQDGFEIQYVNPSGYANFNIYKDSGIATPLRINENNTIDIFAISGGLHSDMITIGDGKYPNVVLAMYEGQNTPASTNRYGKIFINKKTVYPTQSSAVKYIDSSGNIFDMTLNKYDSTSNLVFTDGLNNTLVGLYSSANRYNLTQASNNTSLGYATLHHITSGDHNVAIGMSALSGVTTGSYNIAIGSQSLAQLTPSGASNNIVISNQGITSSSGDYNFYLGVNNNLVLLRGKTGPTNADKHLYMPSGGKFSLQNSNNSNTLSLRPNVVEVIDSNEVDYPQNQLAFKFTAEQSHNLLVLDHSNPPVSGVVANYTNEDRPFAELNGDLRLLGAMRFSDGTSLESSEDISNLYASGNIFASSISTIQGLLSNFVIEGVALEKICTATDIETPTSGIIRMRNGNRVFVTNRDKYTEIREDEYIIAIKLNSEYRPIWVGGNPLLPCCNS